MARHVPLPSMPPNMGGRYGACSPQRGTSGVDIRRDKSAQSFCRCKEDQGGGKTENAEKIVPFKTGNVIFESVY
ncbi:hypothetical protein PoB_002598600 [Plakobranchus ocellatus]|uniref:Uncharacterized protein n=1 Tax=Plakobranchus ocellatus TaxID=259542 RepID=A0AAV3ZU33_9GAST|nr:hypothetical protein PoB_002598600 [Plakobranchus ocellatus]